MNMLILALTLIGTVFGTAAPQITAHHGTSFLIALPGNPTTGYTWTAHLTGAGVAAQGSAYQAPRSRPGIAGAGGQQIFSFDALRTGAAMITFTYVRPWEKHVAPVKTAVFHVTVT